MRPEWTKEAENAAAALRLDKESVGKMLLRCEEERCYVLDERTGHRFCHEKNGTVTVWAEYTCDPDDSYKVVNVYAHRLIIMEEDS